MKFNAFDYISPSIDDVKKLLFPFSLRKWMKLGFIALLADGGKNGPSIGNGGGSGGGNGGGIPDNLTANQIAGETVKSIKDSMGVFYYFILPIILFIVVLSLVITYISSVFSFMFLEALDTREVSIKKSWHRSKGLGFSFFLFKIVIGLIILGAIVLASLPIIIPMMQQGFTSYFENFSLWNFAWMIPVILLLILFFFVMELFMSLVYNFSIIHMYFNKLTAWASVKATFKEIKSAKLAVLVFLVAKLAIGIVVGIIGIILFILLIFPFLLLAIPIGLIFWGIISSFGWTIPIIVGLIVVAIAYIIFFIYTCSVISLPMSTFTRYFSIRNYKELMKKDKVEKV